MARPWVLRPSRTLGLNGVSTRQAALNSRTVRRKPSGSTPASLPASSSSVLASALVTRRMRYSLRSLPGKHARKLDDLAAIFRIGMAVKVGALIDVALALGVDQNANG